MKDSTWIWILGGAALVYLWYKNNQAASVPTQGPTTITPIAPAPTPSTRPPGV
ncbi:MAG: hypothetical protein KGJ90_02600 [Patescibacteria group bacterium]|nr:hypothetical protein [Patescibacteria group bacterium]